MQTNEGSSIRQKVDMTAQFDVLKQRERTNPVICVDLLPEMYQPAATPSHHWLYFIFRGLMRLREKLLAAGPRRIKSFCDIGTQAGKISSIEQVRICSR